MTLCRVGNHTDAVKFTHVAIMGLPMIIHKYIITSIVLMLLAAGVFRQLPQPKTLSYPRERTRWAKLIRSRGAANTYRLLKQTYGDNRNMRHIQAHLFGEALYQAIGMQAVTVCDEDLGFGCFHGALSRAIAAGGLSVIEQLDAECRKTFGEKKLGCQHGIGHGIFEYLGPKRLNQALALCATLRWKGSLAGCQGGVFMEYHFPLSLTSRTLLPVSPEIAGPYDPCASVPGQFRLACVHELTFWWSALYKTDIQRMDALCTVFKDSDQRDVCYWGIGQFAYKLLEDNPQHLLAACARIADREDAGLCRAGGRYVQIDNGRTSQPDICTSDPATEQLCKQKTDMIGIHAIQ